MSLESRADAQSDADVRQHTERLFTGNIPPPGASGIGEHSRPEVEQVERKPVRRPSTHCRRLAKSGVVIVRSTRLPSGIVLRNNGVSPGHRLSFTENLEAGVSFGIGQRDYEVEIAGDQPGESFRSKGDLDYTSFVVNGTYNFLSGPFSPFVTARTDRF